MAVSAVSYWLWHSIACLVATCAGLTKHESLLLLRELSTPVCTCRLATGEVRLLPGTGDSLM